jgi:hypothetical protein
MYNFNYTPTTLGVQSWREIISGGTRTKKVEYCCSRGCSAYTAIPSCSKREYIHPKMLVNDTDKLAHESEETLKVNGTSHIRPFPGCTTFSMPASTVTVWYKPTIMAARWRILIIVHCTARCIRKLEWRKHLLLKKHFTSQDRLVAKVTGCGLYDGG